MIDRDTGTVSATDGDVFVDCFELSLSAIQMAKQVIIQKLREAEQEIRNAEHVSNALQPVKIDKVIFCRLLGRAIVLVSDDQLSRVVGDQGPKALIKSKLVDLSTELPPHGRRQVHKSA